RHRDRLDKQGDLRCGSLTVGARIGSLVSVAGRKGGSATTEGRGPAGGRGHCRGHRGSGGGGDQRAAGSLLAFAVAPRLAAHEDLLRGLCVLLPGGVIPDGGGVVKG